MKLAQWALLAILLLLSGSLVLAQPINQFGLLLNADVKLNVRNGPGVLYDVIGTIKPGDIYTVMGKEGNWYLIEFGGQAGYVVDHLVTVSGAIQPISQTELNSGVDFTTLNRLNMRAGPGTGYQVLTVLPLGITISVIGRVPDNSWYQVIYRGMTGWVSGRYGAISGNIWYLPEILAP
jgi:uncharacterized protein YraI